MSNSAAHRTSSRRETVLWAIPIIAGLLGMLLGFAIATARSDRFEHAVTLVSAHDGRIGNRDNRDLAVEILRAELKNNPPGANIEVGFESRLGTALDITVTAPSQATATEVAERLGAITVERLGAASRERFTATISANETAIASLEPEIVAIEDRIAALPSDDSTGRARLERDRTSLVDNRNELERQIVRTRAQDEAATPPIAQSSSITRGSTSNARRDAGVAGAAAAMLALLAVSAATARRP